MARCKSIWSQISFEVAAFGYPPPVNSSVPKSVLILVGADLKSSMTAQAGRQPAQIWSCRPATTQDLITSKPPASARTFRFVSFSLPLIISTRDYRPRDTRLPAILRQNLFVPTLLVPRLYWYRAPTYNLLVPDVDQIYVDVALTYRPSMAAFTW